jgi:DNA-binding transcriptional LysR family regulator
MDRLTSMAIFVRVVELGSFASAARVSRMSATMVAKHIASLEQRLHSRLIHRTTRRHGLTILGEAYYERCRRLLADVADADALAAKLQTAPRGPLRITAPRAFGIHVLTPMLAEFLAGYPEVTIDVALTDRKVDLIEDGFELAFRIGSIDGDGVIARPLAPYTLMLAASPSYLAAHGTPNTPADLARHELIGFEQWNADNQWQLRGPDGTLHEVPVRSRLRVNHGEAARGAALAGFGIVLQSTITLREDVSAGRLVAVLPRFASPPQPMHLVYLPDRQRSRRLDTFIEFVIAALCNRVTAPKR